MADFKAMPPRKVRRNARRIAQPRSGVTRPDDEPQKAPALPRTEIRDRLARTGKRFYCICFSARSGSTLLCEDIAQHGLGAPTEHFQFPARPVFDPPLADYLVDLVEDSPGEYFGLKVAWQQVYELTRRLREEGDRAVSFDLRSVFPDLAYIHIVRADKIRQAISSWRADKSETWHWPVGSTVDPGRPDYDFEAIKAHFVQFIAEDWLWKVHFEQHAIDPLVVQYEQYTKDREGHLRRIADHLGGPWLEVSLQDRLIGMGDEWTEQIVLRVKADLEAPHQPYWVLPPEPPRHPDGPPT
jgi:LPS sulfotransferase NodH